MFLYDAMGILFLILTGSFLLFLPLATAALLVAVIDKVKMVVIQGQRSNAQPR